MPMRRLTRDSMHLRMPSPRPRHAHSSRRTMEGQSIQQDDSISQLDIPAIYVRNLTKRFAGAASAALTAVDLEVPAGSIHGVLGLSGAGKSTLLRCIARLEKPDTGEIKIAGSDWTSLSDAALRRER